MAGHFTPEAWSRFRPSVVWVPLTVLLLAATFVITPYVLELIAPASADWQQLSAIGETYGAASAFLSGAALLSVAASLVYQRRQTQAQIRQAARESQRELILFAMQDEELMKCWGPPDGPVTARQHHQHLFINLIFSEWLARFSTGYIKQPELAHLFRQQFSGELGRTHWQVTSARWHSLATVQPTMHRFVTVAEDQYQRSVAAGPPIAEASYFLPSPLPQHVTPIASGPKAVSFLARVLRRRPIRGAAEQRPG